MQVILLAGILLFAACETKKTCHPVFNAGDFDTGERIVINNPVLKSKPLDVMPFDDKYKEYVMFYSPTTNMVAIYETEQFSLVLNTTAKTLNTTISGIHPHSLDTIYVLTNDKKIILTDTGFIPKKEYPITANTNQWEGGYGLCGAMKAFHVENNRAFMYHYPLYVLSGEKIKDYYTKKVLVSVNFKDSIQQFDYSISFPEKYQGDANYYDTRPKRIIVGNVEIVSFEAVDSLYIHNPKTNETTRVLSRSCFHREKTPIDNKKKFDMDYMLKYFMENSYYAECWLSKDTRYFFRRYYHWAPRENSDGTLNDLSQRNWSIIVHDSTFTPIKEILFEKERYPMSMSFPTRRGYLLRIKKPEDNENNKTVFAVFKF